MAQRDGVPAPEGAAAGELARADESRQAPKQPSKRATKPARAGARPRTPAFGLSLAAIRGQRGGGQTVADQPAAGPAPAPTPADDSGTERLRRSLADQAAETTELREALNALRQALDSTTPAATPPPRRPRRRRRRAAVAAVAAAGVAAATVVGAVALLDDDSPGSAAPAPIPTGRVSTAPAEPVRSPSVTPSDSPSGTPSARVTPTPMDWPGGAVLVPPGVPTSGPGVDAPGTDLTVGIADDLDSVAVFEQVVLAQPVDRVPLTLPPTTDWPGELSGLRPTIADLQVEIDGVAVPVERVGDGWSAVPPGGGRVTEVVLRYRVAGVVANFDDDPRSVRRLVAVPSLTGSASLAAGLPLTTRISDPRVAGAFCVTAQRGLDLCAAQTGDTFTLTAPAGSSGVGVLQADLRPR